MGGTESILLSVKKLIGPDWSYTYFDPDILLHINTVFASLTQMGVGPAEGFSIQDEKAVWTDFIPESSEKFAFVKTYMYLKVKLVFDPPLSSALIEAMKEQIKELEWRLYTQAELEANKEGKEETADG